MRVILHYYKYFINNLFIKEIDVMDSLMVIKITERSRGLLVTNDDGTRDVVVSAQVCSKATEEQNEKLMEAIKEAYRNYRSSIKW